MSSPDKENRVSLRRYGTDGETPASGERFLIPGPVGDIEAELSGADGSANAPIAVVCHPHPLHGGSLNNKVVHTVARAFNDLGVASLRFNFRGVGHSQGQFDHGIGEAEDLQAVVQWFRERNPKSPLWLAGFSFGAAVVYRAYTQAQGTQAQGTQAQRTLNPQRLLLVAPPVAQDYFPVEGPVDCPWMLIQGSADEVVDAEAVSRWVRQQQNPPDYHCLTGAGHFFHGRLTELREHIKQAWGPLAPA